MSSITPPTNFTWQIPTLPVRLFTVDEYHSMIQAGILTEDDPVELLEGLVVPKMPRNPPHDCAIELAGELLRDRLAAGWGVRVQSAITTADSEPEPDLVVVRGSARTRRDHHPGPQDLALLVEVADSTLARDRGEKARLYARASVVCYWIINLMDRQIEVYTDPTGPDANPTYRRRQDYGAADQVPLFIDGQEVAQIPVIDFLP
jgi:Uma2 family endonuclease